MVRRLLLGLVLFSAPLSLVSAQEPLQPGTRIRVTLTAPGALTRIGRLQSLGDSTLILQGGTTPIPIPLASVARLEVSRGRKLNLPGGLVGFVVGAAAGGAVGCLANRDSYGVFCGGQNDTKVAVGALVGGAVGAALGAYLFRRERWSTYPLSL